MAGNQVPRSVFCLFMVAVVLIAAALVPLPASAQIDKHFGDPVDLGTPILQVSLSDSAYGTEGGRDVLYTSVSGSPAVFNVVDLDSLTVVRTHPLPGTAQVWAHAFSSDGFLYIAGERNLYRYSPTTGHLENLGTASPGESSIWSLTADDKGNVYGGTFNQGRVFKFDPATRQFTDYGSIVPGQNYVRSLAYYEGYLYAGIGSTGSLVRLNPDTGEKTQIPLKAIPGVTEYSFVYNLDVVHHYLFAHVNGAEGSKNLVIYNLLEEKWLDIVIDDFGGVKVSPELEGKVYLKKGPALMEFDLSAHTLRDTGINQEFSLRNSGWVTVENDPGLPGKSLATIQSNGIIVFMNPATGVRKEVEVLKDGQPTPIHTMFKGPDGKLYMSAYPGGVGAIYDPKSGANTRFRLGQAETIGFIGDKVYYGIYPKAHIYELDTSKPIQNGVNPRFLFAAGEEQDRPYVFTTDGSRAFFGTVPDYGKLGGALVVYDPEARPEEQVKTYRNIVKDQSIVGLAYKDGKIYGSTSIAGGLGVAPTESTAKMFVWDVALERKIAEFAPVILGAAKPPIMIGDITFGKDGLLWSAADGAIFAVDPASYEVVKSRMVYPGVTDFGRWKPTYMIWGKDGLLYSNLNYRITVFDTETLGFKSFSNIVTDYIALDDEDQIYYSQGSKLLKIPVTQGEPEPPQQPLFFPNAGFEEELTNGKIPGWNSLFPITGKVSFGVSDLYSTIGNRSLKLTDTSTAETIFIMSDKMDVTPGEQYIGKVNIYIADPKGRATLLLRFFDKNGAAIYAADGVYEVISGQGHWQEVQTKRTAPAAAAFARVFAGSTRANMTAASYYDDFRVTRIIPDRTAPESAASLTPQPNQWGWNNEDVTVSLSAYDEEGGHGIDGLTYSASGAQPIGTTTVKGDRAVFTTFEEGTTTVTYFAADRAGNREVGKKLNIQIDKTAPAVDFLGADMYTIDETVSIRCIAADSLSGFVSDPCSGPLVERPAYELDSGTHTVTVLAEDKAGNLTEAVFSYRVLVTYDSLNEMVKRFAEDKAAIAEALSAKLLNAKEQEQNGNLEAKMGMLNAFIQQAQAHSGKAFSEEQAALLVKWAGELAGF